MGDLLFFLVGWWLAGCLATFFNLWLVSSCCLVGWLVGKLAGCLWQGWEGGLYFYNFMAAPWDGRRSQSRKPLSFRQKSWKREKTISIDNWWWLAFLSKYGCAYNMFLPHVSKLANEHHQHIRSPPLNTTSDQLFTSQYSNPYGQVHPNITIAHMW